MLGNFIIGIRETEATTKFPMYKVWWLREASQIGQMPHSTAEFKSIQQLWLQLDIVS